MHAPTFHILHPSQGTTLTAQADDLLRQINALEASGACRFDALLQARLYVTDAANQWGVLRHHALCERLMPTGVFSYIEQPPLHGAKVALLLWCAGGERHARRHGEAGGHPYIILESDGVRYLWQHVRYEAAEAAQTAGAGAQMTEAFERCMQSLEAEHMRLADHCLRTWIYVRDIDCQYHDVVVARNEVFARQGLTKDTHYIASTGIEGASACVDALVAADFLSVQGAQASSVRYLTAPGYLNPTHEYGVAFERGTAIDLPGGRHYFISGTASIDHRGQCVHEGDVETQAGRLFMNIEQLLRDGGATLRDVRYFIVYLRDVADAPVIRRYMALRFPRVPFLLTLGRVCRPQWLIEVECVAVKET